MPNKKKTPDQESLTFENLYTVRGLYKDGKGNEFHVFISGEKKEVDKFRRFQEHQRDVKSIFGIRATVTKDISNNISEEAPASMPKKQKNTAVEFKSGKVRIGISRHKVVVKKPYKITYHIDPTIKKEGVVGAVPFSFDLDRKNAEIKCTVLSGKVEFKLWDIGSTTTLAAGPTVISDSNGNNSGTLSAKGNNTTVRWQLTAAEATPTIGNQNIKSSTFEIEYTKQF